MYAKVFWQNANAQFFAGGLLPDPFSRLLPVFPAKAGIHAEHAMSTRLWIPAFAGKTMIWETRVQYCQKTFAYFLSRLALARQSMYCACIALRLFSSIRQDRRRPNPIRLAEGFREGQV